MKVVLRTSVEATGLCRPEEMSPSMQKFYRRTVQRFSAHPTALESAATVVPKLSARVILNGHDFESADEMPPALRQFYEHLLAQTLPVQHAIDTVTRVEHANFIKRTVSLLFIAAGVALAIVYLWIHGYYG
jgi:hypothetical protein